MHAPHTHTLSRLACALRNSLLLCAAFLLAPAFAAGEREAAAKPPATSSAKQKATSAKASDTQSATKKADTAKAASAKDINAVAKSRKEARDPTLGPIADFGKADAPADVVHLANWVSHTRNNKKKAFVLIDKKQAQLYVFDPAGKLKSRTPILLGKAVGDYSAPGVGNKPISQLKEEEKTTPAGKFLAAPGKNTSGEDIIWIDYNAAVSMHRLRKVSAVERRAERMATPDSSDNRISNGCVNVPHAFYNGVLKPTVMKQGAYVYVLPETKTAQQLFGSFDVPGKASTAATRPGTS